MTIDPATLEYRPFQKPEQPSLVAAAKIGDPAARVKATIAADDPAGRFAWEIVAGTLLYSANRIPEICDDITAIDDAMRWGYAWDLGPFELWDALGVPETVERMKADGRAIPEWVAQLAASEEPSFYLRRDGQTADLGSGADRAQGARAQAADHQALRVSRRPATRSPRTSTRASSTSATASPASSSTPRPTSSASRCSPSSRRPSSARARSTTRSSSATRAATSPAAPTSR